LTLFNVIWLSRAIQISEVGIDGLHVRNLWLVVVVLLRLGVVISVDGYRKLWHS